MSYDSWKTTDPSIEYGLSVGEVECPYCDAVGYLEDEDGKHVCPVCKGRQVVDERDLDELDEEDLRTDRELDDEPEEDEPVKEVA